MLQLSIWGNNFLETQTRWNFYWSGQKKLMLSMHKIKPWLFKMLELPKMEILSRWCWRHLRSLKMIVRSILCGMSWEFLAEKSFLENSSHANNNPETSRAYKTALFVTLKHSEKEYLETDNSTMKNSAEVWDMLKTELQTGLTLIQDQIWSWGILFNLTLN